jgi:heterodisulfide reductase subunit C
VIDSDLRNPEVVLKDYLDPARGRHGMAQKVNGTSSDADLNAVVLHTGIRDCYQCGKCTAGCPMGVRMDVPPSQLIRFLQLGYVGKAMRADSIWLCVSCQTCAARCPKSVDCAGVMDELRQLSLENNVPSPAQKRTVIFQKAFLENIRRYGRLNELELIGVFKSKAFLADGRIGLLLKDATLAPQLSRRRKLHLSGEKVRARKVVDRIFARCLDQ